MEEFYAYGNGYSQADEMEVIRRMLDDGWTEAEVVIRRMLDDGWTEAEVMEYFMGPEPEKEEAEEECNADLTKIKVLRKTETREERKRRKKREKKKRQRAGRKANKTRRENMLNASE